MVITLIVGATVLCIVICAMMGGREVWDLDEGPGRLMRLKKRRERLLRTIKDLETEKEAGTLSNQEFRALRNDYKREAIAASKELERARQARLRRLTKGAAPVTGKLRNRVEALVEERKAARAGAWLFGALLALLTCSGVGQAAVTINGVAYDSEASFPGVSQAVQRQDFDAVKQALIPFSDQKVTVELVALGQHAGETPGRVFGTWTVDTDAQGNFSLETGLPSVSPDQAFLARAADAGAQLFSPFFTAAEAQEVILYRTSSDSSRLFAQSEVFYDYVKATEQADAKIRVQFRITMGNFSEYAYVGEQHLGGQREILRIPLPSGAEIVENSAPGPARWVRSPEGNALIINTPVAGLAGLFSTWKVSYDVPAQQEFVQIYRMPFATRPGGFGTRCVHDDMALESAQLRDFGPSAISPAAPPEEQPPVRRPPPGVTYDRHQLEREIGPNSDIQIKLTVDNAPIGQVSRSSTIWVALFLLSFLVAILAGLSFGKRGSLSLEERFGDLGGDELLDRIVDLDESLAQKKIKEADYRSERDALMKLVAEEFGGADAAPASSKATAVFSAGILSVEVRDLLRQADELEEKAKSDTGAVAQRAHVLEALAKALPREARQKKT